VNNVDTRRRSGAIETPGGTRNDTPETFMVRDKIVAGGFM
jgi:hypothetical protein